MTSEFDAYKARDSLYYRLLAQALVANPGEDLAHVGPLALQRLRELANALGQAPTAPSEDTFRWRRVVHPHLVRQITGRRLYYLVFDARASGWSVLNLYKNSETAGDVSLYHIFGQQDVILRLHASEKGFQRTLHNLADLGVQPDTFEVERFYSYHRFKVPETPRVDRLPSSDVLESAVRGHLKEGGGLNRDAVQQFTGAGVFLGATTLEDVSATGRVLAFIGLKPWGPGVAQLQHRFGSFITDSLPAGVDIVHAFGGRGTAHDYLVVGYFDSIAALDTYTDRVGDLRNIFPGLRIETATFVVAKIVQDDVPALSREDPVDRETYSLDGYRQLRQRTEQELRHLLSEAGWQAYGSLEESERAFLLWWMEQYARFAKGQDLSPEEAERASTGVRLFVEGYSSGRMAALLQSAEVPYALMNDTFYQVHELAINLYYDSSRERALKELEYLKPEQLNKPLTAGDAVQFFEAWNSKSLFRRCLAFPEALSELTLAYLRVRNPIAHHGKAPPAWSSDISLARRRVGTGLLDGFGALFMGRNVLDGLRELGTSDKMLVRIYVDLQEVRILSRRMLERQTQYESEAREFRAIVMKAQDRALIVFLEERERLLKVLDEVAAALKPIDSKEAERGVRSADAIRKGLATTADVIQVVTFLTGFSTITALIDSPAAQSLFALFKYLGGKLH